MVCCCTNGDPHLIIMQCGNKKVDATSWSGEHGGLKKKGNRYLDAVLSNCRHPIYLSGIRLADQMTMLMIANRTENNAFKEEAMRDSKNDVRFNVDASRGRDEFQEGECKSGQISRQATATAT